MRTGTRWLSDEHSVRNGAWHSSASADMHAYRLANRLDVRERRANAAVADELRGEAAKQGLALVGRTAEVVNLVAVALRAGKRRQPATRQLRRSEQQARQSRADGWTLEAVSGSVPRQHAPSSRSPWSASTQQQQRQAGSAQAARRPKPGRPSPEQEVDVTLTSRRQRKGLGRSDLAARSDLLDCEPFHIW